MKKIIITLLITFFVAFSVKAGTDGENSLSKKKSSEVKDCFEGLNRATFAFNLGLDRFLFEPIAKGYRKLPTPIRKSASNVVANLSNLTTIPNNFLQGDFALGGTNVARFGINTTAGILGIFNVASKIGFSEYEKEDYGQTLGVMGAKSGCYLVLPVLGPSTVRDSVGLTASMFGGDPWYNVTVRNNTEHFRDSDYYITRATSGTDFRAKNIESFDNLEKNSMDFYASVRSLYLQDRTRKISNSNKVTTTQDDSDWEELEIN